MLPGQCKAKVNALYAMQANGQVQNKNLEDVRKYLALIDNYLDKLS